MKQRHKFFVWIGIPIVLATISSCGNFQPKPTITFSHILSDQSEWHAGALKFKELIDSKIGDRIDIRLITTASLSKNNQRTELEMVQAGTLGGSWESSILLTTIDPRWTVWSLPWLFDSYEEAAAVCDGPIGQEMLRSLEEKGIVGLGYGFNGFRQITNSRRTIHLPEHLENLKIRVPSIQMFISLYHHWKADPSQMNFGDLFIALQQKTMDGQENPLHVIRSRRLYELQPYLSIWNYSFDPIVFCMSEKVWDTLSPEIQNIVRWAAQEASKFQRQTVVENESKHLNFFFNEGLEITMVSPEDIEKLKESARVVYAEYKDQIGIDLLSRFLEATGNDPAYYGIETDEEM